MTLDKVSVQFKIYLIRSKIFMQSMNIDPNFNNKQSSLTKKLRPKPEVKRNSYDARIPRKTAEAICNVSTNTLVKLEDIGIVHPEKRKHGAMKIVTYSVTDIQNIFKYKNIGFKNKKEAEVISIFSQKGGVGKSAFTQHLGSMLSLVGKVLIVDLDAQADSTTLYGIDANYGDLLSEDTELEPTIAELMDWELVSKEYGPYEKLSIEDVIKKVSENIDIIPSDLDLGEINYSLNRLNLKNRINDNNEPEPGSLFMVQEVIDKVKEFYDYIIIDCPPNIETCNVSALFASNRLLIPLELEAKSLLTMRRNAIFLEQLRELHEGFNWEKVLVVPNKFRKEKIKLKALTALEDKYFEDELISLSQVVVPNSSIIDKCSDWKKPIFSATHRFGNTPKSAILQGKEFTNYFWAIMHEILDLDLDRLVFDNNDDGGE